MKSVVDQYGNNVEFSLVYWLEHYCTHNNNNNDNDNDNDNGNNSGSLFHTR